MAIHLSCNSCGHKFGVPDSAAGKKGKCPKCRAIIQAPAKNANQANGRSAAPAKPVAAQENSAARTAAKPKSPAASSRATANAPRAAAKPAASGAAAKSKPTGDSARPAKRVPVGRVAAKKVAGKSSAEIPVGKPADKPQDSSSKVKVKSAKQRKVRAVDDAPPQAPPPPPAVPSFPSEPSGTGSSRSRRGRRRKGMPVVGWLMLLAAGVSAAAGWAYLTMEETPSGKQAVASADGDAASRSQPSEAEDLRDPEEETTSTTSTDSDKKSPAAAPKKKTTRKIIRRKQPNGSAGKPSADPKSGPGETLKDPLVDARRIEDLVTECATFSWQADKPEQFEKLAELAQLCTGAFDSSASDETFAAAREALDTVNNVDWSKARGKAINKHAAAALEKGPGGTMFVGTIQKVSGDSLQVLLYGTGTQAMVKIQEGQRAITFEPGRQWLVVGVITPNTLEVAIEGLDKKQTLRVIDQMFLKEVVDLTPVDEFAPKQ